MANLNATYILTAYKAGKMFTRAKEGELRDPSSVDIGISPLTPLEQVLDIESTPIPGTILEALTEDRMGYPRRIHPLIAANIESFIPGLSVLRIDAVKAQEARAIVDKYGGRYEDLSADERAELDAALKELDPWEDAEAMTFATDSEYEEYRQHGTRTLINERTYLPPGIPRFLFENSPFGELNKILMKMPTNIPLVPGEVDYRSKYEQVQDPDQILQWARFVLGVDIQEVSPEKSARLEERRIPRELQ